ncbi:IS1/IS1595 family N-terminal zinc-binding domain-containing protein [Trichothermofontia sp.]
MTSTAPLTCPSCNSTHVVKNSKIHNGKQNFKCRECGRETGPSSCLGIHTYLPLSSVWVRDG